MSDYKEIITMFYESEEDGETERSISLSFETVGGMNIEEFHRNMKRFAIVCGYSPKLVEEYFGEDIYDF